MSNFGKPARFRNIHSSRSIAVLTFGLMINLVPLATFAAVMPEITDDWGLTASEGGWIGGIYFGGYAASVPILASATDRIDGRWTFVGCWRPSPASHSLALLTVSGWPSDCAF